MGRGWEIQPHGGWNEGNLASKEGPRQGHSASQMCRPCQKSYFDATVSGTPTPMQPVRRAFLIRKIRSVNGQVAIVRDDLENLYSVRIPGILDFQP